MTSVTVNFDSTPHPSWADIDFFGVRAAQVLADLLPGVQVRVTFKKASADRRLLGVKAISHSWEPDPNRLQGSFMQVPGSDDWYREIEIAASGPTRQFLWPDHPRQRPSREIRFARAICEDISRAWTLNLDADENLGEIRLVLSTHLPVCIVSHIAADLCYDFDTYGTGRGKHDVLVHTLMRTIDYLDSLAGTRVEHQTLSHGVVIGRSAKGRRPRGAGVYPDDFRTLKRTPLLTDGIGAALWLSPAAQPIGIITPESLRSQGTSPRPSRFGELAFIADASAAVDGLAVALRSNGSLVVFGKGRPMFVRRGGTWRGMMWPAARAAIRRKFKTVGTVLFDAALLLSTTGHGGILGIVEHPNGVEDKDKVQLARVSFRTTRRGPTPDAPAYTYPEWVFHSLLPTDAIISLGPAAIATLASIDGAIIVTPRGRLFAYGAVLPSRSAGSEGARSAAARHLSSQGFVIKVSADGPITLFENGKEIIEV